jgi:hypothetical protein
MEVLLGKKTVCERTSDMTAPELWLTTWLQSPDKKLPMKAILLLLFTDLAQGPVLPSHLLRITIK